MSWKSSEDCFILDTKGLLEVLPKTEIKKCFILRAIEKIFDYLAMISPFATRVKRKFLNLCFQKNAWDGNLPANVREK